PGIDGIELCRKIRSEIPVPYIYIILVTSRNSTDDIALGLDAGADDYVTKPFHARELYARVEVGMRILDLQDRLESRVRKLKDALSKVRQLQGLVPICSYCHRVRNDTNYWEKVEQYITEHTDARVSHSVCPDCYESMIRPQLDAIRKKRSKS
ncbi:MAG TPA: response regulator transcription factor, partial [bacterium]|nr:response regulator transcription factor [bacterium]